MTVTRRGRLALTLSVLVIVGVLVVGGLTVLRSFGGSGGGGDYAGPGTGTATVEVATGDSVRTIAGSLAQAGVIKSVSAFTALAATDDRARSLQPGYYKLRQSMSAKGALDLMLDPSSRQRTRVTVPEGLRVSQTLDVLAQGTEINRGDLEAAASRPADLGLPAYAPGLEGFLFPATYDVSPNSSATDVLVQMTERYLAESRRLDLDASAAAIGSTPLAVVTTASIIEKEVAAPEDRGKVARVIANRLAKGMPLQMDSTVQYALGTAKQNVTTSDTDVDSPYNTYKIKGLPPGPIASPGTAALQAALAPTPGDWLYFITLEKENKTYFTSSLPEFQTLKARRNAQNGITG